MAGAPILVVDDAAINLKVIRMALMHEGYEVRTAERAEEALEMLSNYQPELILTDVHLPGMSGFDMTRKLKENPKTSSIRVVALTTSNRVDTRETAFSVGCEEYICKPIDTPTLAAKVRELLNRPRGGNRITPSLPAGGPSFSLCPPDIDTLRRRFLNDGVERSWQLLEDLNGPYDTARAAAALQQLANSAGLLDYNDLGALAQRAERLLYQEKPDYALLRENLTDLYLTFSELAQKKVEAVPDKLLHDTAGKRVALIGFSRDQAEVVCATLARLKALPLLFQDPEPSDSVTIGSCDVAVIHVRKDTLGSWWLRPESWNAATQVVLLGARPDLLVLSPEIRMRAADFLMEGEHSEMVLMRLAFVLTSRDAVKAIPPVAPVAAVPVRPRTVTGNPTVVVADDDAVTRILTSSLLKNHGMTCRLADNGTDALKLVYQEQPEAVLLDVNMPGMSGFEVLAAIRSAKLPCRVMLLTAREQEDDIVRGFDLGADDYLTKPFNPFELVARVKRFLM